MENELVTLSLGKITDLETVIAYIASISIFRFNL